ncbi:MAG TPA: type II toxin-antitoxin system VapC family toxin [Methanothrix sp.]|nr:type II toxin-antitoxin system VapC family toxin [Methanothrix sp.]
MLVLDTTILIDALHRKDAALRKIVELEETEETLCTTQINALELYKGAYLPTKSNVYIQKVKKLLDAFVVLPLNDDTYEWFAALSAKLRSRGESINDFDELIAAITMTNGASIVSNDSHFRRIPGLEVISY